MITPEMGSGYHEPTPEEKEVILHKVEAMFNVLQEQLAKAIEDGDDFLVRQIENKCKELIEDITLLKADKSYDLDGMVHEEASEETKKHLIN